MHVQASKNPFIAISQIALFSPWEHVTPEFPAASKKRYSEQHYSRVYIFVTESKQEKINKIIINYFDYQFP